MSARALVIGEALIDIVERDGQVLGEHVGGSPLNVAVGLGRLDRDVDFLTHIGDDERGRRIVDYVEASGVQLVSGSTRRRPARRRRWPDSTPPARRLRRSTSSGSCPARRRSLPRSSHTPGRSPAFLDPGCLATAALLDAYRPSATITYDPNVRPALIADREQAIGRIDRLVEKADVVKASDEDLRWIDPTRTPEQIATAWQALGPSIVAVTMGERGAFAMCAAGTVRVAARPVAGGRHRRRRRLVHDRAHRRPVVAGPAGRRPARGPGAHRHRHARGRAAGGVAGVGGDRRARGRGPAGSRRSATGLTTRGPYWVMRSIWKGSVAFGLVNVPVKVYSATEDHDIKFHQVHAKDNGRIRYKRVCEVCGEVVEYRDIAQVLRVRRRPDGHHHRRGHRHAARGAQPRDRGGRVRARPTSSTR